MVKSIKTLSKEQTSIMSEEAYAAKNFVAQIVIIGDSGTGKTALLKSFQNSYKGNLSELTGAGGRTKERHEKGKTTSLSDGVTQYTCKMPIRRNNEVNVKIVDTPGSPQKRNSFLPQLSGKNGAVVVYDITNLESYYNARNWIKLVQSKSGKDIIISLVGTKLDLIENENSDNREVGREVAEQFC